MSRAWSESKIPLMRGSFAVDDPFCQSSERVPCFLKTVNGNCRRYVLFVVGMQVSERFLKGLGKFSLRRIG